MQFQQPFDASQVPPAQPLKALPEGWYKVVMTKDETKPGKNQGAEVTTVELTVAEGEYQGRKVYERLNLVNPNQQAVEIAWQTLSAICRAIGKIRFTQSSELYGIPFMVRLSVRPGQTIQDQATGATKTYQPQNEIDEYANLNGKPLTEQTGAPGTGAAPSWVPPGNAAPAHAAPAAAAPPPVATPAPAPAAPPQYVMTAKANGLTREAYHASGWNDELLVNQGMMQVVAPVAPPAPAAAPPPAAPLPPPGQPGFAAPGAAAPAAATAAPGQRLPSWMTGQAQQ